MQIYLQADSQIPRQITPNRNEKESVHTKIVSYISNPKDVYIYILLQEKRKPTSSELCGTIRGMHIACKNMTNVSRADRLI
jgi:hypothetical protein